MGSNRDGQNLDAEAVNDEAGQDGTALEADEAADSIRLQLTVRELLL
ncbi:hypothetical protein [Arthrobacter sp. OAP107]